MNVKNIYVRAENLTAYELSRRRYSAGDRKIVLGKTLAWGPTLPSPFPIPPLPLSSSLLFPPLPSSHPFPSLPLSSLPLTP